MVVASPSPTGVSAAADLRAKLYKRNVKLIPFIRCLRMALIAQGVIVYYWQNEIGCSVREVLLLQTLSSVWVVLLEVPSGYLSDRIGRKRTLLLSALFNASAFVAYALAFNVAGLAVAETLLAVGYALWSGTDVSILYESLKGLGSDGEGQALGKESRTLFFAQATEATAAVIGGYIGTRNLRAAMWATAAPFLLVFAIVAVYVVEPAGEADESRHRARPQGFFAREAAVLKGMLAEIRADLRPSGAILLPFCAAALIFTGTYTAVWLYQPLWAEAGMELSFFGWAWAIVNLAVSAGALLAVPAEKRAGTHNALCGVGALLCASYALCAFARAPWALVVAGCFVNSCRGITAPVINTYINRRVPSERRATLLSVLSLAMRTVFCVFSPINGAVGRSLGLHASCLLSGFLLGGSAAAAILAFRPVCGREAPPPLSAGAERESAEVALISRALDESVDLELEGAARLPPAPPAPAPSAPAAPAPERAPALLSPAPSARSQGAGLAPRPPSAHPPPLAPES
eukprot:tig00020961_g16712.t1